jgi:pimeloyl-ACP methyl ester carboxylesterase
LFFIFKGVKINYTIKGDGQNLLFLHGWGGSTQSFLAFENRLQTNRRINIDFPPFGFSDKMAEPWTVETYAEMVMALLKELGVTKVFVVAHSFGARVAIMLAQDVSLVQKLVLTGAAGLKPKKSIKKSLSIMRYKLCKRLVKIKLMKKERLSKFGSSDYRAADGMTKQTIINITNFDQTEMLKNITAPTLLLWGKDDTETPLYMARKLEKLIKDSALIVLNGGHFAYIENFEQTLRIINSFLGE